MARNVRRLVGPMVGPLAGHDFLKGPASFTTNAPVGAPVILLFKTCIHNVFFNPFFVRLVKLIFDIFGQL